MRFQVGAVITVISLLKLLPDNQGGDPVKIALLHHFSAAQGSQGTGGFLQGVLLRDCGVFRQTGTCGKPAADWTGNLHLVQQFSGCRQKCIRVFTQPCQATCAKPAVRGAGGIKTKTGQLRRGKSRCWGFD